MAHGGARPGAGRKPISDEGYVRDVARAAIEAKHGTVAEGLKSLLESGSDSLIKFVYEHAIGKPKEKVELSTDPDVAPVININVIRKEKETDKDGDGTASL